MRTIVIRKSKNHSSLTIDLEKIDASVRYFLKAVPSARSIYRRVLKAGFSSDIALKMALIESLQFRAGLIWRLVKPSGFNLRTED